MSVRQCPDCELRFLTENELRDHLDNEHPGRVGPHLPHPERHAAWAHEPPPEQSEDT